MKAYSLEEYSFSWSGVPIQEQRGEITITANAKNFALRVGNDGVATLVANKDKSHTVKVKCFQSSEINSIFSATLNAALLSPGGNAGIVPMAITDRQGNSVFVAAEAFLTGWPEKVIGSELGDEEWEILVPSPERFDGGN
jgi:hypothetical protein